jgi:hypothetical protein
MTELQGRERCSFLRSQKAKGEREEGGRVKYASQRHNENDLLFQLGPHVSTVSNLSQYLQQPGIKPSTPHPLRIPDPNYNIFIPVFT